MVIPLVSVVIPTIGRTSLRTAVESVVQQSVDAEILIVDDSPNSVVEDMALPDVAVIPTGGGQGAGKARNIGIAAARGEFIAFLDDDDVWLPRHLANAVHELRLHPGADIYASRALVVRCPGVARIEPAVLAGSREIPQYLFGWSSAFSRSRRILTPTIVFRQALRAVRMQEHYPYFEDTRWLLELHAMGAGSLIHSSFVGAIVYSSVERETVRYSHEVTREWLDHVERIYPGGSAVEIINTDVRRAARDGDCAEWWSATVGALSRPRGWTFAPLLGAAGAAASLRARLALRGRQ